MSWHNLYIRSEDSSAVADTLRDALQALGYTPYDPFPGGVGTPLGLKTFAKHFVAPAQDGWVRVLGEPDQDAVVRISQQFPLLHAWLSEADSGIAAYKQGVRDDTGLAAHLLPGKTIDHLNRAQAGTLPVLAEKAGNNDVQVIGVPVADLQQLIGDHNVNSEQASNMISKLTSQLFGKMDKSSGGEASRMQEQARSMLAKSQGVNWNSPAAQRLKGIVSVLALPVNWRDPDFDTVREAYQVARRLRRSPNAQLMPDEQDALKALPNAIDYQFEYVGK